MKTYLRYSMLVLAVLLVLSLALCGGLGVPVREASGAPPGGSSPLGMPFTDNAVIQRDMPAPVFGEADDGTQVTVEFNGQVKTTAASGGKWQVTLDAMATNTSPGDMVVTIGSDVHTLTGLQVGEVWLCSGQSNMLFALNSAIDGPAAAADAPNHNIRLFEDEGPWAVADESTAGNFSAICYWMGHELSHAFGNDAPIGLIQEAVGGTDIHEWTHCCGGRKEGHLYDDLIVPLQPYALRGVNWYQGENDAFFNPEGYYDKMIGLMNEWRTDWGQSALWFQLGQLHWKGGSDEGWASVRQDLLDAALDTANTNLAVNVDVPEGGGHPPVKKPIGIRFGIAARGTVYGESIDYSGPIPNPALSYVNGSDLVIGFDHLGNGLITGSEFQPAGDPAPFRVAGSDDVFYDATAQIVGDTVVVSSASVPNPVSVHYIWDIGQGNLYSEVSVPTAYGTETRLPAPLFTMTLDSGPTPTPGPTDTPIPPTDTPEPTPTNTPGGPTNTPIPPTDTPEPTPTNTPGGGGTIFFDGFEDGDLNGWATSGNVSVQTQTPYAGTYHARPKRGGSMWRTVSTVGYTGIHLKYAGKVWLMDAGELLLVEWYDGSTWTVIDQITSESYVYKDWTLPAGAANNPDFAIRFTADCDKNTEWADVDNIEISGQ
jgi:sialate O-acetylesterase